MQLDGVLDAVDAEIQHADGGDADDEQGFAERPAPSLRECADEAVAGFIVRRFVFREPCGGHAGYGIREGGQQKRQPRVYPVQEAADGTAGHIHHRVTSFVEATRLGIVRDGDDLLQRGVRGAAQKTVDRRGRRGDHQQRRHRHEIETEQDEDRSPAEHAGQGVDDDQGPTAVAVNERAPEYAAHLLGDHRGRPDPSGGDRGTGDVVAEQGYGKGAQCDANRRGGVRREPCRVPSCPPQSLRTIGFVMLCVHLDCQSGSISGASTTRVVCHVKSLVSKYPFSPYFVGTVHCRKSSTCCATRQASSEQSL